MSLLLAFQGIFVNFYSCTAINFITIISSHIYSNLEIFFTYWKHLLLTSFLCMNSICLLTEIKTEKTSTTTTSQSTVHNTFSTRSSEEKMDHQREKQLFSSEYKNFKREEDVDDDDDDKASMRPDEKEISVNRLTTITSSTIKTTMVNNNKRYREFNSI